MSHKQNEKVVDQILVESMNEPLPAEIERRLRAQLSRFRERMDGGPSKRTASVVRWTFLRRTFWIGGTAAALVAGLAIYLQFFSSGARAYASAMRALQKVDTVHATGWKINEHKLIETIKLPNGLQRSPVETWEWSTSAGEPRLYETKGSLTVWDDGRLRYEHSRNSDRLHVRQSRQRDLSRRFPALAAFLRALKQPFVGKTSLPKQQIAGRAAWGIRIQATRSQERREVWFDLKTDLPVLLTESRHVNGRWIPIDERTVTYNEKVPANIRAFQLPKTKTVTYDPEVDPAYEKWRRHLRQLAEHYREHPLPETMELLPRPEELTRAPTFAKLPGHKHYQVWSVSGSLSGFVRHSGGWRREPGRIRVDPKYGQLQLNHDLVFHRGVSDERKRLWFTLDRLGFEIIEATENRKVLIARYDGRPLKPWPQVNAPVPLSENGVLSSGMPFSRDREEPTSINKLFRMFNFYLNQNLSADNLIIIDETGLPSLTWDQLQADRTLPGSSQSPFWGGGEVSSQIAKQWFLKEFGITLNEQVRPVTLFIVKQRE